MRIRTVKPEFWGDEKMAPLDALTRLVFLGLISIADDAGRLLDSVKMIDGILFTLSDDSCSESLAKLARMGRIERGITASGQKIIQITNWHHQKIDHPNLKAALPRITQPLTGIREGVANDSRGASDSISTSTSTSTKRAASGEADAVSGGIKAVLDRYQALHPKRKVKGLDGIVRKALKDFTGPELIEAIEGNAVDQWHRERKKHELSYVLRNADIINGFRERATAPPEGGASKLWAEMQRTGILLDSTTADWQRHIGEIVASGAIGSREDFEALWRKINPAVLRGMKFEKQAVEHIAAALQARAA